MQPARIKLHAKEHTNNPVQRPNFRGQGTKKETPKDQQSPRSRSPSPAREYSLERKPKVAVLPRCLRAMKPIGDGRRRKEEAIAVVQVGGVRDGVAPVLARDVCVYSRVQHNHLTLYFQSSACRKTLFQKYQAH